MSRYILSSNELYHHGIQGQKWGERRFQNEDGSLTPAGRERYGYGKKAYSKKEWKAVKSAMRDSEKKYKESFEKRNQKDLSEAEKVLKRKRELYNKAHRENMDYLDKGELGRMIYDSNTKRAKNAYAKAQNDYDKLKKKGNEYVSKKMKEEFGKDYDDWNAEQATRALVTAGAAAVAATAAYTWALKHA